ncbi:major facilitator superfamily domain-containing protein [Lentinula edodes]|uniref:major facilitator superfamily domain-containing protein n=1 Tax=Lentinula edodes TaxID=5353 RepID=UPI001E8DEC17|nr:major facilitator superfamily domain-containing protein [Lentinula edodes]KAH7867880.1 major facilitator superfamily domain-containing protein [Lentinula edodes]
MPSSSETRDHKSELASPDGSLEQEQITEEGFKAWCTVIGGFFAITAVFGYQNAFGVYQDVYVRSGAASAQAVSWIGSTQIALMVALGLPAGKLLDLGYFKAMTIIGSIIYVFSIFMLSIAHTDKYYQLFLSQGLAAGIGAGLVYVPVLGVQTHHWRRRSRPVALGIVITGSSVGGIIFPIMLNNLIANPNVGFAWAVRASAFVCLGLLVIANILMTTNPPPKNRKKTLTKFNVLFTDVPYILGVIGAAVSDWGLFFPYFYLQLFAIDKGANPTFSFYLLAILNGSSIPGRIIPNILSHKFGVFNTVAFCTLACSVLTFGLLGVGNSVAALVIFAILYGFFSGGFISLLAPVVASLVQDESEIGIRLGLAYCISSLGILTGNPIAGALLGTTFPWWRAILFSAVMLLVGLVLILVARTVRASQKQTQRV